MKRRTFLKGTTATVGMGGLAGCSSVPFIGGDGGTAGGVDWMPDPAELDYSDMAPDNLPEEQMDQYSIDQYGALITNPSQVYKNRDDIGVQSWEEYRSFWADPSYATPLAKDMNLSLISFRENTVFQVFEADFNPDRIQTRLENDDYSSEDGEYDEYEYYLSDTEEDAYAFTGDTFVAAGVPLLSGDPSNTDVIETVDAVIGAGKGDIKRYADENDGLDTAVSSISDNKYMAFEVLDPDRYEENDDLQPGPENGEFEEQVAGGASLALSGSETEVERVLVFESESSVDEGDIETYTEEASTFSNARNIEFDTSGNIVTITNTTPTMDAI